MKALLIIISLTVIIIGVSFIILGKMSASGRAPGLVDNKLAKCGTKPNCVCSEYSEDTEHYISPINVADVSNPALMVELNAIIRAMGGEIDVERENYIAARFTSKIFHFVDDLEIRLDHANNALQLRSASRVGYSDGGVNKKRIMQLKKAFAAKLQP